MDEDNRRLVDYGCYDECTVHLVLRLRETEIERKPKVSIYLVNKSFDVEENDTISSMINKFKLTEQESEKK